MGGKYRATKSCSAAPATEVNTGRLTRVDEDGWTDEDGGRGRIGVVRSPLSHSASGLSFPCFPITREGGRREGERGRGKQFPAASENFGTLECQQSAARRGEWR